MQDLIITIVQTDLTWRDAEKNLQRFDRLIDTISDQTDLIILPEMFTTGFAMEPELLAEEPKSKTFKWMLSKASERKCAVTGSYIVKEDGKYFNRLYFVLPSGESHTYDKRHLFRMAGEDRNFSPGSEKLVFTFKNWKICPLICYDLRFPVWSRNRFENGVYEYDLLIYVANWPEIRNHAWNTLLKARAIENQAYVAGVNRIGPDGKGIPHSGDSAVIDPWGTVITHTQAQRESVETVRLDASKLNSHRNSLAFGMDQDKFQIL
mgnify:CR=1 FL=1